MSVTLLTNQWVSLWWGTLAFSRAKLLVRENRLERNTNAAEFKPLVWLQPLVHLCFPHNNQLKVWKIQNGRVEKGNRSCWLLSKSRQPILARSQMRAVRAPKEPANVCAATVSLDSCDIWGWAVGQSSSTRSSWVPNQVRSRTLWMDFCVEVFVAQVPNYQQTSSLWQSTMNVWNEYKAAFILS